MAQARRGRFSALLLALAVSSVALLSVVAPAGAATFNANPATLGPIPDGVAFSPCAPGPPRNVEFNVSGLQAPITDVQVTFAFSPMAEWVGDVVVTLISPGGGATQTIFGRTGLDVDPGFGDNSDLLGPYTFADSAQATTKWWDAAAAVGEEAAIASGSYRASTLGTDPGGGSSTLITPTFAALANPNGVWTLQFNDWCLGGGNTGSTTFTGSVSAATLGVTTAPVLQTPSNQFSLGKLKLNKDKGTATLTVDVPGAGNLVLAGKGIVKQPRLDRAATVSRAVSAAGKVKLKIKAKGKKKAKLNDKGKVTVRPKITFTPTGGTAFTQSKKIKLKKNP